MSSRPATRPLTTKLIFTFGLSCFAPCAVEAADAIDYLSQAIGQVGNSARILMDKSPYGYIDGLSLFGGWIPRGGSTSLNQPLNGGTTYAFIAGGDDDATDVDLIVLDRFGNRVAVDQDDGSQAIVEFTPPGDASYTVKVVLAAGRATTSFCALALMKKGGWDVPVNNLIKAAGRCVQHCKNVAERGNKVRFHSAPNQWAIFGAVLKSGGHAGLTNFNPGGGSRIFVAAADVFAQDVDLYVTDSEGNIIAKDDDDDNTPVFRCRILAGQGYGVYIKNARSEKPSLVIGAVLSED